VSVEEIRIAPMMLEMHERGVLDEEGAI